MQYLGGKSKIRKEIARFLESVREGRDYLEPFVGGGWVLQEMTGRRTASDGNAALIAMYRALQHGWEPPDFVSESEYIKARSLSDDLPMKAFIGFGCSFAGKWFGGYARSDNKTCYAVTSKRSLMKQLPLIQDVQFTACDYREHKPVNMLVYCDPPYANTTSYSAFNEFNHNTFWETMRQWSASNMVVISEYSAPDDFICVAEFKSRMGMTAGDSRPIRSEKLFMIKPDWLK